MALDISLKRLLKEMGIGTEGLCFDPTVHTTLAIVQNKDDGDRDFWFYRNPGADIMLCEDEIREELISDAKILHLDLYHLRMNQSGVLQKRQLPQPKKQGSGFRLIPI